MRETVIVGAVRTPVGRRNGGPSGQHAADLSAVVLTELAERTGVEPAVIDDVIWGCVSQVGDQSSNIGRYSVLAAGWPEHIPGTTVNRACGSESASPGLRGARGDVGPAGCRRRGRCRGDEPRPPRIFPSHQHAVRPESICPV